jgi:hypothetical protein
LDQNPDDLAAEGNGGMRQMHNYVDLNTRQVSNVNTGSDDFNTTIRGAKKMADDDANQQMEDRIRNILNNQLSTKTI